MNHTYAVISFIGFVVVGASACFVLARDPGAWLNRLFCAFAAILAFYDLFDGFLKIAVFPHLSGFFLCFSMIFWIFFLSFLLHFFIVFSKNDTDKVKRFIIPLLYGVAAAMALFACCSGAVYVGVEKTSLGCLRVFGSCYWLLVLYSVAMVMAQIGLLFLSYKRAQDPKEKSQSLLILAGLGFSFVFGLVYRVVMPAFGFCLPSVLPAVTTIFILFIALAMVKHGLLERSARLD